MRAGGSRRAVVVGASLQELLVVLGVGASLVLAGAAAARRTVARHEALGAARAFAAAVRGERTRAVASARRRGLVFQVGADGLWRVSLHEDGDGDGIRSDDVASGADPRLDGPRLFSERFGGGAPGFVAGLDELRKPPPSSELLDSLADPVRFGVADTVSFGPRGRVSTGTLYVTDGHERQFAVVVYGTTGRVRVWEHLDGPGAWVRR